MPTPPHILNKIKLLLKLATSPNPHEAESAQRLADGLIEKHGVTAEEIAALDPKPLYGDNDKLYTTIGIVAWRQQLAVAVATHLECQIVQVELVPSEGEHPFEYYVYGEPEDVKNVQFAFRAFAKKVEFLADTQCLGRGPVYVGSYCEGVVDAIKQNIVLYGIDLPEIKKPVKQVETQVISKGEEITKPKPEAAEKHIDISGKNKVQDIMAYFKGVADGRDLFLEDILAIASENEEAQKLQETSKVENES